MHAPETPEQRPVPPFPSLRPPCLSFPFLPLETPFPSAFYVAGVGITDGYQLTADGLDFVFGVNFVGHFELTMKLMPLIQATPASR